MQQNKKLAGSKTPSATEYNEQYYLSCCGGYEEFLQGRICRRHRLALQHLQPQIGESILDIGCGRGELIKECNLMKANAIGIDYSPSSIKLAAKYLDPGVVIKADATILPFSDNLFHKVSMLDVVEHLDKNDLIKCLAEIRRVLKEDGWFLLHTPNLWGEILDHIYQRIFWRHRLATKSDDYQHLHVNLLTPMALKRLLKQLGFAPEIWFATDSLVGQSTPKMMTVFYPGVGKTHHYSCMM